jgi:uncharacterized damage-inducible protein DinB
MRRRRPDKDDMMFSDRYRDRLLAAVAGLPAVLDSLLNGLPSSDPRWDMHPEPGRFSLREIAAHLADWDAIWLERLAMTRDQDNPSIVPIDEGELAVANDYAHRDPDMSRALLHQRRTEVVKLLRALGDDDWDRPAMHPEFGTFPLKDQAIFVVLHDGYHTHQVARWLTSFQVPAKA